MIDAQFELSAVEHVRLMELERSIENGLRTFVDVGMALLEIRDSRLYRTTHGTFEDYCRERWGMSKPHATRLIVAAEVTANLVPMGTIPTTERQARPLTVLEPEQQREAWRVAVETAPDGRMTAAHVESTVCSLFGKHVDGQRRFADTQEVDDRITTERVGIVVWELATGNEFTTAEVAELVNMTMQGAHILLAKLCRVLPVSLEDGIWRRME